MNIVEIGLAFIEGLALIASPCILPVLPIVLSTSLAGSYARPYGIIVGFIASFSLFAFGSYKIVQLLNIDIEWFKWISLVLLALLGLILLSNTLSNKLTQLLQPLENANHKIAAFWQGGFFSGIMIGSLIGLVWTPCAGPILASALVQIIRQQSDIDSLIIIISFTAGAAIPMLLIVLMGRKLMKHFHFFTRHAIWVRKGLGIIILAAVAWIASGYDSLVSNSATQNEPVSETRLMHGLLIPYTAPELTGIEAWLNSTPLTMANLKGKVVLIDFWTYSCINCIRTLPYITSWDKKYRSQGLVIIGVHAPEFEFEKNINNVKMAIEKYHIQYPVALDNQLSTWDAFRNSYWPAHYLINQDGQVVYTHFGEGNYDITENNIRFLLKAKTQENTPETFKAYNWDQTPETYLGYQRMERFASQESPQPDTEQTYLTPTTINTHQWALAGKWKIEAQKVTSVSNEPVILQLQFHAKKVFLVMGNTSSKPITVKVFLNKKELGGAAGIDAPNSQVVVNQHRLYELVNLPQAEKGLLEIQVSEPGFEAYAFTFGN